MRKKFLPLFLLGSLAGAALTAEAQTARPCVTDSMVNEAARISPDYARSLRQHEERIRSLNTNPGPSNANSRRGHVQYTIPVVVHIIHTYGNDNISDAQVHDAIRVLNEDFRKLNKDTANVSPVFKNIYAKVDIEFKLAQLDTNGVCTNGITRTYSPLTNSASNNVKDLINWHTKTKQHKYLNIWVVETIASGAGGYSYLPCLGGNMEKYEGIVVLNKQFGSIGRSGGGNLAVRTLTHEVGHYLGLPHTWGGSNTPGLSTNCTIDDGIADTPNTVGTANQTCNQNQNTCDVGQPGDLVDNVQNYMDYSNCGIMFTEGQKAVMHNELQNAPCRMGLWSSTNLALTGTSHGYVAQQCAPKADFSSSVQTLCEGAAVAFKDETYNASFDSTFTYSWSFPGAATPTSFQRNPTVIYPTAGVYPVTLTVTNSAGNNSVTKTNFIKVKTTTGGEVAPFIYGFENAGFPLNSADPSKEWEIEQAPYSATALRWERTNVTSSEGNFSVRLRHPGIPSGTLTSLISPNIVLPSSVQPVLLFDLSYARRSSSTTGYDDELKVYISTDCGRNWIFRYGKAGANLATVPGIQPLFVPTSSSDWRTETINLGPAASAGRFIIKFETLSKAGNNLYIDNIRIGNPTGTGEEIAAALNLSVYPNPSDGNAFIGYHLPKNADVAVEVTSITGQKVAAVSMKDQAAGNHELSLQELAPNVKAGMYLVKLTINGHTFTRKAVVY